MAIVIFLILAICWQRHLLIEQTLCDLNRTEWDMEGWKF